MKRDLMALLLLAAALLSSTACVSLSLAGEKVQVTKYESDVEGCRFLGEVAAHPPYHGPHDAMYTLRNEAGKLGGDVVVSRGLTGTITGKVYDCGAKYQQVIGPWAVQRPAEAPRLALELRLVIDKPVPGSIELTDESGEALILSPETVVTERDVTEAAVMVSAMQGTYSVSVSFSPEAAERMHKVSGENVGRRMAFVLDGKVFMAPYIRATLDSPVLIDADWSREEAERVAERLAP